MNKHTGELPVSVINEQQQRLLENTEMVHKILIRDDFSSVREELTSSLPPFTLSEFITEWKASDDRIVKIPIIHAHDHVQPPSIQQHEDDGDPFTALMPVDLISQTLKRAFFVFVQNSASADTPNFEPYVSMIHKLYGQIRSLIPSRPDLHPLLNDDDVKVSACSADEMLTPLVQAGEALMLLEAPIRTESTSEWLRCVKWLKSGKDEDAGGSNGDDTFGMEMVEFAIASTVFLLIKADICCMDIAHEYLLNVVPYIKRVGNDYERNRFQKKYGAYPNSSVPYTKEWLRIIYKKCEVDESISTTKGAVTTIIRTQGFVNHLLFYNSAGQAMLMPEIFEMDLAWMNQIRSICRSAVIGSALFLHACNIASTSSQSMAYVHPLPDSLRLCKDLLVTALTKKYNSNQDLEDEVVSAVENIAKTLCPSLITDKLQFLRGCSIATIRGEDQVLNVLDGRLRNFFLAMCAQDSPFLKSRQVPAEIKTGKQASSQLHSLKSTSKGVSHHKQILIDSACQRGLSFFAEDLAVACDMAASMIDLAWNNYGELLLIPLFREVMREEEWID
mmetsp:Transcript_25241/g.39077  ORF Transcript_25241/g.39077 Transcript_25241/m.39077 type:complete len:560 (+) Transcript_25241:89-1768(+)